MNSLSLVWNRDRFIEDFADEKVELNSALMRFHGTFHPLSGMSSDSIGMKPSIRICLYAYQKEKERKIGSLKSRITMPPSLSCGDHWGFLTTNYLQFRQKIESGKKEW